MPAPKHVAQASANLQSGTSAACAPTAAELLLRPEQPDDQAWLEQLYASTRSDELAGAPWPDAVKRAFTGQQFALQRAHYRQHFADADFMLVQVNALRVGRLYLHRGAAQHTLVDISLLPDWRGQGIGSQLIARAQAWAGEAGCVLSLHVLHSNPAARRLYDRHGFVAGCSNQTHLQMHWQRPAQSSARIS